MRALSATFLLLVLLLAATAQDKPTGTVEGQVIDPEGRPVAKARVRAFPVEGPIIGILPEARTDASGYFRLPGVRPGDNHLYAIYTEGGYPDGSNGIFTGARFLYQDVTVDAGRTLIGVVLRLPDKGGRFTASIVDDETGAPVLAARIHITRADLSPDVYYESGPSLKGVFDIVLTNARFRVQIRAAGYESWTYSGLDGQGKEMQDLVLAAGATEEVTVKLHRVKQAESQ